MPNKTAHRWSRVALEIASIVFAVLVALGTNAWYTHHQEQALVLDVLANVRVELETNLNAVRSALPYHQMLRDTLMHVIEEGSVDAFDLRGVWRGAQAPALESTAYETASITQALSLMPFETASTLARVYREQAALNALFDRYLEAILTTDSRDAERLLGLVSLMAFDILLGEEALVTRIEDTLSFLERTS